MSDTKRPSAWCVRCERQSHIYDTKSDAMFWGKFMASYSATPVLVSPLYAGRAKKFAGTGKKPRKPVKVWIPKVLW